jgi:hypothetical protein
LFQRESQSAAVGAAERAPVQEPTAGTVGAAPLVVGELGEGDEFEFAGFAELAESGVSAGLLPHPATAKSNETVRNWATVAARIADPSKEVRK